MKRVLKVTDEAGRALHGARRTACLMTLTPARRRDRNRDDIGVFRPARQLKKFADLTLNEQIYLVVGVALRKMICHYYR